LALPYRIESLSDASPDRVSRAIDRFARLTPRTLAVVAGGAATVVVCAAWTGGTLARQAEVRIQAERIQAASAAGFTEEALAAAAGGLDDSALAIARRHDPYTVAGSARRDRQAELMEARLEQLRDAPARSDLRRTGLNNVDPAAPFRLGSSLDASRDLECLTQAAYYEARGEGRDGMRAVTQVILNRVRHSAFPKTVCGVVYQGANRRTGCQFSFTCNGSMRGNVNRAAWNRARDVASQALSGQVYSAVGNATHFHTTAVSPRWRHSLVRVNQVGSHLFYRFGGRSGSSSSFRYEPRPSGEADAAPRLMQASLDPTTPIRQAGQAIAYTALLAQEGRTVEEAAPRPEAAPTPAPAPKIEIAPAPVEAAAETATPAV